MFMKVMDRQIITKKTKNAMKGSILSLLILLFSSAVCACAQTTPTLKEMLEKLNEKPGNWRLDKLKLGDKISVTKVTDITCFTERREPPLSFTVTEASIKAGYLYIRMQAAEAALTLLVADAEKWLGAGTFEPFFYDEVKKKFFTRKDRLMKLDFIMGVANLSDETTLYELIKQP